MIEFLFRVDGGGRQGIGHFIRCLNLASLIKKQTGHGASFITRDEDVAKDLIAAKDFKSHLIPRGVTIREEINLINEILTRSNAFKVLIVDLLDTSRRFMQEVRKKIDFLVTLDNLGPGRYIADICINAILEGLENKSFLRSNTRFFIGPAYLVLDERFMKLSTRTKLIKDEIESIFVSFGGTDPQKLTKKTCLFLSKLHKDIKIKVIIGPGFKETNVPKGHPANIELLYSPPDLPEILSQTDLAIVSPGITSFEAMCVGTPVITISQHLEQLRNAERFEDKGACVNLGLGSNLKGEEVLYVVKGLIRDKERREKLSRKGKELVDGWGIRRVFDIIMKEVVGKSAGNKS